MITLNNVRFGYPGSPDLVVWDRFKVERGSLVALLGPSGCGKSTVISLMAGLLTPLRGDVLVGGMSPANFRKSNTVSMVFQRPVLLSWRSAYSNLRLPFELRGQLPDETKIRQALEMVGLSGVSDLRPNQLSGGMRSRVALAQALVTEPKMLLLDEPFASLDEPNRIRLSLTVARIQKELGVTTVFVTHNISDAIMISDRLVVMARANGDGPTQILEDIEVPFPNRSLQTLESPGFSQLYQRLAAAMSSSGEAKSFRGCET